MISFALVGCGNIGQRHADIMASMGRIIGVVDVDRERADAIAVKHGTRSYKSFEELCSNNAEVPDVVAICTPSGLHPEHSIAALKAGCHVICEKPMAIHSRDAREMIQVAEAEKRHLFIVKQNRYNPPIIALHELLIKKELGRILSVQVNCFWNRNAAYYKNSWRGKKELAGGTLYTQFSHFIDLLIWLFGEVRMVKAISGNLMHEDVSDLDDQGIVMLEWPGGCLGSIHYTLNSFNKNMEGSITVFGEKGTVKVGGQYLNVLEYQQIQDASIPVLPPGNVSNNYGYYQGSMSNHENVYKNVTEVIEGKAEIATSGREGLKTIELIEGIYLACQNNQSG